jgi:hypothetical protein
MKQLYDSGREGFLDGSIDWDTDDIRVMLVLSTYTFSAAHKFLSEIVSYDNGRSAALTGKAIAAGVADAADSSLVATAAGASKAIVVYKYNVSDSAARLICYNDGRVQTKAAAGAASGATALTVDALPDGMASGAVLALISGTGPATITTSAVAAAGARSLAVVSLSSAVSVEAVYEYAGSGSSGLPFTPAAGQTVSLGFDNGADKIFKL